MLFIAKYMDINLSTKNITYNKNFYTVEINVTYNVLN